MLDFANIFEVSPKCTKQPELTFLFSTKNKISVASHKQCYLRHSQQLMK